MVQLTQPADCGQGAGFDAAMAGAYGLGTLGASRADFDALAKAHGQLKQLGDFGPHNGLIVLDGPAVMPATTTSRERLRWSSRAALLTILPLISGPASTRGAALISFSFPSTGTCRSTKPWTGT